MKLWVKSAICCVVSFHSATMGAPRAGEFQLRSADGVEIRGEANNTKPAQPAVIFVPGTGLFDRDANFGETGTPRDLIFKDLVQRMEARGLATVRYEPRGVRYGVAPDQRLDRQLLAKRTTVAMAGDLAAVYEWTRSPQGLGARCVAFFAHSEGMLHVARMAANGVPPPALVIGMGAAMQSPAQIIRWQLTERDAYSLEMMDADRNGITTNDEVRANWQRTPTGANRMLEPLLHPDGAWTAKVLAEVRAIQTAAYEKEKEAALSHADSEPYPNAETVFASYEWWKSWFIDERPTAERLRLWNSPVSLHYGDMDSQTIAASQIAAASSFLDAAKLKTHIHSNRGHTLGEDVLFGPIDEAIAEKIADEAAGIASSCVP